MALSIKLRTGCVMKKTFIWLILLAFLTMGLWVLVFPWIGIGVGGDCADEVVSRSESPGGKYEVVVYLRDCGATTSISTHATVLGGQGSFDEKFLVIDGEVNISVVWASEDSLVVRGDIDFSSSKDVYLLKKEVQGLSVITTKQ
jgi:hypothetical protein